MCHYFLWFIPLIFFQVTRSGGSNGLLDDGRTPSRWNKCRFRCQLCGKLSSEKRHVRDHITKVHGLNLSDYEATYGRFDQFHFFLVIFLGKMGFWFDISFRSPLKVLKRRWHFFVHCWWRLTPNLREVIVYFATTSTSTSPKDRDQEFE